MILFNKYIIVAFPFPIFLTCWHMLFATILTRMLAYFIPSLFPGVSQEKVTMAVIKSKFSPVACAFSISLIFGNLAYIYLSVSFIQMIKAFTPVSVLAASVILGLDSNVTRTESFIVVIICIGVAITTLGELNFQLFGFMIQLLGIICESSRLVLTTKFLKDLELDALSTLYYMAPLCFVLLLLMFFIFEYDKLPFDELFTSRFSSILLANAIVAFSLNIALLLVLKYTSALTLTFAGVLKDILLIFMSMFIFGQPVTQLQYFGYFIALSGINIHKEYKKNPKVFENVSDFLISYISNNYDRVTASNYAEEKPLL